MPYTYEYPRPALTVDVAVVAAASGRPCVLLVQRAQPPFAGQWALPGGFVDIDERVEAAAHRELREETGIEVDELALLGVYDAIDRDPRGRSISVVYVAELPGPPSPAHGGDDAEAAAWHPLDELPGLAFDHDEVLREVAERRRRR